MLPWLVVGTRPKLGHPCFNQVSLYQAINEHDLFLFTKTGWLSMRILSMLNVGMVNVCILNSACR